jgi:hypothetical protein
MALRTPTAGHSYSSTSPSAVLPTGGQQHQGPPNAFIESCQLKGYDVENMAVRPSDTGVSLAGKVEQVARES